MEDSFPQIFSILLRLYPHLLPCTTYLDGLPNHSTMETPNKKEEPSSSPELSMTASSTPSLPLSRALSQEQESNRDSSSDVVIMQPGEHSLNALGALGTYAMEHSEDQIGEEHQNTQSGTASTTEDPTHAVSSSNNPTPPPYQTRRARRRGRTFDQSLLEYNLANPPTQVTRRRYRSMSEMDCPLARGFIDSTSPAPLTADFCMEAAGFWDIESSHFCLRCGSDHF